jgi:hypothetical protein
LNAGRQRFAFDTKKIFLSLSALKKNYGFQRRVVLTLSRATLPTLLKSYLVLFFKKALLPGLEFCHE